MSQDMSPQRGLNFDELVRRALKTPPISNEEIERRSKDRHKG
jgi:hypothetical protein